MFSETGDIEESNASKTVSPLPLLTAQVCFLESGWRSTDCAALYYVTQRRAARAGVTHAAMLVRYSAIDSGSARAREVSGYPWGVVQGKGESFNKRWAGLRVFVTALIAGEVADTCPGADHWGGPLLKHDAARAERALREGRWVRVQCAGDTANAFYREVRRSKAGRVIDAAVAKGGRR